MAGRDRFTGIRNRCDTSASVRRVLGELARLGEWTIR
jgi:hypothetical protein